jgi:hypothetical protein
MNRRKSEGSEHLFFRMKRNRAPALPRPKSHFFPHLQSGLTIEIYNSAHAKRSCPRVVLFCGPNRMVSQVRAVLWRYPGTRMHA